jgi:hypothetical protein
VVITTASVQRPAEGRHEQYHEQPGHGMHAQVFGLDPPAVAEVGVCPQRDGRHHHQGPGRPQHIAARAQAQRQGEHGPEGEELPRVGAGLVGLAEVGEQGTDAQQREQRQRHPRDGPQCRASTHRAHEAHQQREAPEAAERLPVGGDPHHHAKAQQRRGHHRQAARQAVRKSAGLAVGITREWKAHGTPL